MKIFGNKMKDFLLIIIFFVNLENKFIIIFTFSFLKFG